MARLSRKQKQAKQAKELLDNETLSYIFDTREREIYERWKGSQTVERREACFFEITALEGLRDAIYATTTE